jgi:hypothetical protein
MASEDITMGVEDDSKTNKQNYGATEDVADGASDDLKTK